MEPLQFWAPATGQLISQVTGSIVRPPGTPLGVASVAWESEGHDKSEKEALTDSLKRDIISLQIVIYHFHFIPDKMTCFWLDKS